MRRQSAVVGVGSTQYYKRGQSLPQTTLELASKATLAAVEDAGLSIEDVDGFSYYAGGQDTGLLAQTLGIPEIKWSVMTTAGGGGAAGSVGLAAAAVASGMADVVVCLLALQQNTRRFGANFVRPGVPPATGAYAPSVSPEKDFISTAGLTSPGQMFALLTQRHMHQYGTRREAFAEVAISARDNASRRPTALKREPLTLDDYFSARMIADPLCLLDYCQESDGACAVVVTSAERAKDLRHPPVHVLSSAHGGDGQWGTAIGWHGMPEETYASSGHRPIAKRVYERAGVGPADVDVALLYDHFTSMVVMQLEDYGFCPIGEGGAFVEEGNIRWKTGTTPVNTHGGNHSEAYIIGMTHIREAVEQLRGTAVNQVEGAEVALVTGGPAGMPVSATILGK